jgi:hypothetical protein
VGVAIPPPKADPPLIVHPNAVLAPPISLEHFQSIPRRNTEIIQALGRVQLDKLPEHDPVQISRVAAARHSGEETLSLAIGEAWNHSEA